VGYGHRVVAPHASSANCLERSNYSDLPRLTVRQHQHFEKTQLRKSSGSTLNGMVSPDPFDESTLTQDYGTQRALQARIREQHDGLDSEQAGRINYQHRRAYDATDYSQKRLNGGEDSQPNSVRPGIEVCSPLTQYKRSYTGVRCVDTQSSSDLHQRKAVTI
jgi:hypothetical protein